MRRLLILITIPLFLIITPNVFSQSQEETFVGTVNIGHTHFDVGDYEESFYLFDYEGFSNPPIKLKIENKRQIQELTNAAGSLIAVKGIPISESRQLMEVKIIKILSSEPDITISFEKDVYTWNDKVRFKIDASSLEYLDPNTIDQLGNGIGGSLVIKTSLGSITNLQLTEREAKSGIFEGEIILTGNNVNPLSDLTTGFSSTDTGSFTTEIPEETDSIQNFNFLNSKRQDSLIVYFESNDGKVSATSVGIRLNVGTVTWNNDSYRIGEYGEVIVIDPDMNFNPEMVDSFKVKVWSNSDVGGIDLTVTETNVSSGEFHGTVTFTNTDEQNEPTLYVSDGDIISVRYEDSTLPYPHSQWDVEAITDTSVISQNPNFSDYDYSKELIHRITHQKNDPNAPKVSSRIDSVTVLAKFADSGGNNLPHTLNYFEEILYDQQGNSLAHYYKKNSFGKLEINGTVTDWKNLPYGASSYVDSFGNLIFHKLVNDVITLADPDIDFNGPDDSIQNSKEDVFWETDNTNDDIDQVIIITNGIGINQEQIPKPQAFAYLHPHRILTEEGPVYVLQSFFVDSGNDFPVGINYQKGYGVVAHEIGHNFQWFHTPMLTPHDTYSDPWSIMSGWNDRSAPSGPIAYHKNKANWIEPNDRITVDVGEKKTVSLDFLNEESPNPNSYHIAIIPFGIKGEFYTVEARQDTSFDHIPEDTGVMIYRFNPDGYGDKIKRKNFSIDALAPVSVYYDDEQLCVERIEGKCVVPNFDLLDLEVGETKIDAQNNVTISIVSESLDGFTVTIDNNSKPNTSEPIEPLEPEPPSPLDSIPGDITTRNNGTGSFTLATTKNPIDLSKSSVSIQNRTITVLGHDGFSGIINLTSDVTNPLELSSSINPSSVFISPDKPEETAILSVSVIGKAKGSSSVTVTGTSGDLKSDPLNIPINGGCLIATATYGTPMAKEVQMLREIRDNQLLKTESGKSFMNAFNELYYSFSPTVAQWERDSPIFKEAVKISITPLITSLSIMSLSDDNEFEVIGYGVSVILLNLGMYIVAPVVAVMKIKKIFRN
ncbi:hypothetical protein C6988_07895 [Nitrosopumilus sp. b1]|uniref:CFI-box-CTERM domain-containing protein n=1 Tax=Nitrosopumilus sp. b1 TaxID=2109907 RepID=UPI0015F44A32|nr:hypothetical protein C6988_07895 [Nitrosopumilus sp. b1]